MGEDPGSLIYVTEAKDVRFAGNTILGMGRFNIRVIQVSPTASISGSPSGVKLE
jgi:hypothetical protein